MVTPAKARAIALSMPGTDEQDHRGHPSFRVRTKIFETLWPDERRAVVTLPRADQAALVGGDSEAFYLNAWSRQGWTNVHLKHVGAAQFAALRASAWRQSPQSKGIGACRFDSVAGELSNAVLCRHEKHHRPEIRNPHLPRMRSPISEPGGAARRLPLRLTAFTPTRCC
jgi:hypothetical protein